MPEPLTTTSFEFVEVAVSSPRSRGSFIHLERFYDRLAIRGKTEPIYRSVYLYNEEGARLVHSRHSAKDFDGPLWCDFVPIDIDLGQNTPEFTQGKARSWFLFLEDMGLSEDQIAVYFSGSGFHIYISSDVFGIEPDENFPFRLKETMLSLAGRAELVIDPTVYSRSSIIRAEHSLNLKTGRYKIPLSKNELFMLNAGQIQLLASQQRLDFPANEPCGNGELSRFVVTSVPEIRQITGAKSVERRDIATCMHTMFKEGPQEGNRNHTILRLASFYRRQGIPQDAAKAILMHWNDGQLNARVVNEKVESVYARAYQYGCNDPLLKAHCSTKCMFYKNKNITVEVKDADALQKELVERSELDLTGQRINLGKALGVKYHTFLDPGDMLTIFGPTGCNKTALAQCIALGYDPVLDEIDASNTVPTLYLSMELSGQMMHRRNLQIVSNASRAECTKSSDIRALYAAHGDKLRHLFIQNVAPTIEDIKQKIQQYEVKCVIVDYIDLVQTPVRGEYEQVKYVSHQLRNLATTMNIIIIQLSQVNREYSRLQALDLFAGKGGGAIENASSFVAGISNPSGDRDNPARLVEVFKATDGELFETNLNWTPSFRLVRGYNE